MHEVYLRGPVSVRIQTYEDLMGYKGGIYYVSVKHRGCYDIHQFQHRRGKAVGAHSVKLIGWGEVRMLSRII